VTPAPARRRTSTIASKLISVNMLVSGVALGLACLAFGLYDRATFRAAVYRHLSIQAQIVGANSVSALTFGDPHTAEATLNALRASPNIVSAGIVTAMGDIFASYRHDSASQLPAPLTIPSGDVEARFEDSDQIALARRILFQGKDIGHVVIRSDVRELNNRRTQYITNGAAVLVTALIAAFFMSLVSQRTISRPIVDLEKIARQVSIDKDYSIRAPIVSETREINVLVDAFNEMLAEIERRDESLRVIHAELEARVRARTTELDTVNKELEAFSYSVSHDLRAPLRHVAGFAGLLEKRVAAQLDNEARRYLETIATSAGKMGRLIDDLLAFSQMSRTDLSKSRVSLNGLVRDARQDLASEQNRAGHAIDWQVGDLPDVLGDQSMMRQVIVNLVSNAVKYSSGRPEPRIEIGANLTDTEVVVFVRDNGVGFDMQYAHKLFGVFQRLHGSDEFEGTGIGLANVQRIIHRHGGRVWAEGTVGQGATFYFSVPPYRAQTE
jgi:signal transduction histidine kinase